MFQQAEKIVRKFGGAAQLAKAIGQHRSTVFKWTYPKERGGTGGLIPTNALGKVLAAAKRIGIPISPEDLIP